MLRIYASFPLFDAHKYASIGGQNMFENIIFAFLVIIAIASGIWVWWLENHETNSKKIQQNRKDKW